MGSEGWLSRIRAADVRLLAAIAATLMLVVGVMWVVPTTPTSNSFTFDPARRGITSAHTIELAKAAEGNLVDGSDMDFYRIDPLKTSYRLDVHMANGSANLIPGLRVLDAAQKLIQDRTAEYVRKPGADIDGSFIAQPNTSYYIQV